ncbi:hypothetical protein C6P45_003998 [Maudiozyma exigua]|uniref:Uncharacterized protein n=1 Tax=Maudiozyma exigua TaxID=34358 RepID=A0A9P7BC36_MAUEX|nr:hypothetical protein C6P45_003998 [Kazachstania exigua]
MGLDQEKIKKRLSQIELDIDKMNQMIDDNLQLGTGTNKADIVTEEDINEEGDGDDIESEVREVIKDVVENPENNITGVENTVISSTDEKTGLKPETGLQRVVSAAKSIGSAAEEMVDNSMDAAVERSEDNDDNNDMNNTKDEVLEAAETSLEKVVSAAKSIGSAAEEMIDNSIDATVDETAIEEPKGTTILQKVVSGTKSIRSAAEEMIDNSMDAPVESSYNSNNDDDANTANDEVLEAAEISLEKVVSSTKSVESAAEEMIDDSLDAPVATVPVQKPIPAVTDVNDDTEWEEFIEEEEADDDDNNDSNKIILPKHTGHTNTTETDEIIQRITSKRLPSRSFRVISVGSVNPNERNVSRGSNNNNENSSSTAMDTGRITSENDEPTLAKLEQRYDYLTNKTTKLTKEISYLTGMMNQGNLSIDDTKRLKVALTKLQEYLDRKTKERYETGVLLSRHLRRQIDRGENGQFWVGNK